MLLYFAPLACSLATRIAFYEAGHEARYVRVDTKLKRTEAGDDFFAINPMGQVPVLELDDGTRLSENAAVLQAVATAFPSAHLAPDDEPGRARLRQWLGFVGTELHKAVFVALLDPSAPPDVKTYARAKIERRFAVLEAHLSDREFLLDRFSVADAYLGTILNWAAPCKVDLGPWPSVVAYRQRLMKRPSFTRAAGEEFAMYQREQASFATR